MNAESLKASELVTLVVRNCDLEGTTGIGGNSRVLLELNQAQVWLGQKLVRVRRYWNTVTTQPMSPSGGRLALPDDFYWERRLLRRVSTTPERWEQVSVVHAEEAEGYPNTGNERQTWTVREGFFIYEGPTSVDSEVYKLDYLPRLQKLEHDDDVPTLPAVYHHLIATRASFTLLRALGHVERAGLFLQEIQDWEKEIQVEEITLDALRAKELPPKGLVLGTLGWIREEVRKNVGTVAGKGADFWSPARVDPEIDRAIAWYQLKILKVDENQWSASFRAEPVSNRIQLPKDFLRLRGGRRLSGDNHDQPTTMVFRTLSSALRYGMPIGPLYESENAYPFDTEQWVLDRGGLKAVWPTTLSGTYEIFYNFRVTLPQNDNDKPDVREEALECLVQRAAGNCARIAGDKENAMFFWAAADKALEDLVDLYDLADLPAVKQSEDVVGFEDMQVGGWENVGDLY